ncbi:diguanylate cyclase [Sulfurimonas sp. HSL-3221]|uniref:diguanylate cyclase n=1 Tax=Sulfurimonadaceae TaxID=2771471 RepID=UPI001E446EE5|nr:diguanylate cyclase [Sulfurimonas sp. HSL-3221]UFS62225.1 diguanylate cyclase [Sulfurimonas sp. HSL-3221]
MKGKIALLAGGWILVVLFSWTWEFYHNKNLEEDAMLKSGRAFFQQIVLTREWNARHGGVYVFADESTPPNPHLKNVRRDIPLPDGQLLTLVNPAYMTRQLSELAEKYDGLQIHITSLRPIRPENAPKAWERTVLESFYHGAKEYGAFFDGGYRYMAPLYTEKSCLKCHASQGYKVGDIRGAVSVTIPHITAPQLPLGGGHLLIALSGLGIILLVGWRLRRAYQTVKEQSMIDPLTGIANRRHFMKRLKEEYQRSLREQHPVALIMADIDSFKAYNDTYGHIEGDQCLLSVAHTMQEALKRPGDCIARYGGEEFIIMLPNTPLANAAHFAEELRRHIEALKIRHESSAGGDVVTASFGIAETEPGDPDYEAVIRRADAALYAAKAAGRNRVNAVV